MQRRTSIQRQPLRESDMKAGYRVDIEQEEDGRFLAEVVGLPGVMAYGTSADEALAHVQALALRVLADGWSSTH